MGASNLVTLNKRPMHKSPRLVGILLAGLLLASGFSARAAEPSSLQPVMYVHTKITESTQLIALTDEKFSELLTQFNQTYETNNDSSTAWIAYPPYSEVRGLGDLFIAPHDPEPSDETNEPEQAEPVSSGTHGDGTIPGGLEGNGNDGLDNAIQEPEISTIVPVENENLVEPEIVQPIVSAITLRLSEIYPNTTNGDLTEEFIEVQNTGNTPVLLRGWSLEDASGKIFTVTDDSMIEPFGYSVIGRPASKLALNNDVEIVRLNSPDGTLIDQVAYDSSPKGSTLSKINGEWVWSSERTPGSVNTKPTEVAQVLEPAVNPVVVTVPTVIEEPAVVYPDLQAQTEPTELASPETVEPEPELPVVKTLRISELFPNTLGDDLQDEFIEIQNIGHEVASLKNWMLSDASGKTFTFSEPVTLQPFEYFVVTRPVSKLALNNDADTLVLSSPDQEVVDQISYPKTIDGSSLSLVNGNFVWTVPTPGTANTNLEPVANIPIATNESTQNSVSQADTSANQNANTTSQTNILNDMAFIVNAPDGTMVNVEGQVLVVPGVLGKQIFYLESNGQGIQIYKNDAVFPDVQEGQTIRVNGELSTSRDERRIKITTNGSMEVLDETTVLQPIKIQIANIDPSKHAEGQVVTRSTNEIILEDQGEQLTIGISDYANIDTSLYAKGDMLRIQGIVVSQTGSLKLKPRSQSDIEIVPSEIVAASASTTISGKDLQLAEQTKQALLIGSGTGLVLLALLLRKYHPKFNTSYEANHTLAITTPDAS